MFGTSRKAQVLVVGAGPVGLFAALHLVRQGLDVAVIDSQWRTAARSYALALHPRSLDLLDEVGVAQKLIESGRRVERVGFYDHDGKKAAVDLTASRGGRAFLLVLPQSRLEELLERSLTDAGGKVLWNHRLSSLDVGDRGVTAVIEQLGKVSSGYSVATTEWLVEKTLRMDARFVIGADGYHSAVRRLSGLEFESLGQARRFAVFECESDRDAGSEIRIALGADTSGVYWPLPGARFRWSFELREGQPTEERAKSRLAVRVGEEAFPYLRPESLHELLAERVPWFDAPVASIAWSVGVRFEQRLAAEFGRGPVCLIGDAAHVAGPIGVQSMNAGLREASMVVGRLSAILDGSSSPEILESFNDRRRKAWRQLLTAAVEPLEGAAVDEWVAARARRIPPCLPATGDELERLLAQLGLRLAE